MRINTARSQPQKRAALASRDPALRLEVCAQILAGLIYEHKDRPADELEAITKKFLEHILGRIEAIANELTELLHRAAKG